MKVLITGANGFLGQHLTIYLQQQGFNVVATNRGLNQNKLLNEMQYESLDLTNEADVMNALQKHQPKIVVHTAAMSKPDECENDKAACILHNVTATKFIAEAANSIDAKLIYISTDFIFGEDGPHAVDAMPEPLNFYGESKLQAEEYVKANSKEYAIVRPVFIYGKVLEGMRPSFLHWVKNNLEQNKPIKVVNDQRRTPTYVIDICKGLEAIINQKQQGAFHLAGKDIVSPYQMALAVCKQLQLNDELITPVNSATFPEPVKRAQRSGLKIDHSTDVLGYAPTNFSTGITLSFS